MNEMLLFIIKYCSELYYKFGFKFVYSDCCEGDNSILVLESSTAVKFMFMMDRKQMTLEIACSIDRKKHEQYSFELVRKLITGESDYYTLLDDNNGAFLRDNLDRIVDMFMEKNIRNTTRYLKELEKKRAKLLFG